MNAIILAAGEGRRLRPLTNSIPKGMINFFGKSLLERQIEVFRKCKINDITIVTGYCNESITFSEITYFFNNKFSSTNMVETLFCAEEKLFDSTIVSYGDIIFEVSVLEKLLKSDEDISIVVDKNWKKYWEMRFENPLEDAESLTIDKMGFIQDIGRKVNDETKIEAQYIGLMKFQHDGIKFIKKFYNDVKSKSKLGKNLLNPDLPFEKSYLTDFIRALINNNCKVKAVPISNGWLELDSLDDYKLYEKLYQENKLTNLISLEGD